MSCLKVMAPYPLGLTYSELAHLGNITQEAIDTLIRHDVIEEIGGEMRIVVELFRRWVLQTHTVGAG